MLNQVTIMGRLAVEPVLEQISSGIPLCKFRVASERDFPDRDGNRQTDFLSCVAWRNTATFLAKNFAKGSMLIVQGHLREEVWKDAEGKGRSRMVIEADNIYFGETKQARMDRENRRSSGDAYGYTDADVPPEFAGDGQLPF